MSLVENFQSFMMCAPIFHSHHAILERSLRFAHLGPKMYGKMYGKIYGLGDLYGDMTSPKVVV